MNVKTLLFGRENHIGRRLIVMIVAFSSLVTLFTSIIQLALEYRGLRDTMERQLDSVGIYVPTIQSSVWDFDEQQIQRALDALVLLPDVAMVRVYSADSDKQWHAGTISPDNTVTRTYSLRHTYRGKDTEIGRLEIIASLDSIQRQVIASAVSILVSNALKTFFVVLFMIFLIRRLVTTRLEAMAHKVREQIPGILPLSQREEAASQVAPAALDELDAVDWTLDRTTADLGIAVATLKDLNEKLDQTVRERTRDLEAAIKELKAFSYTLSHDMKAPLRAMGGYGKILTEDFAERLGDEGKWIISRIVAASDRMDTLINDTLGLYKVSESTFKQESLDLTRIASEIAADLADADPKRTVEWQIEDGMQAVGDPGLIRTALENLIGNAWKYSSKRDIAQISIGTLKQHDGSVAYYVKDNGAGFDMAYADKLFLPFQRLHRDVDFPGNGVGLATVRKIMSRHKGRAWGEAKVDQGATFCFTLSETAAEAAP